MHTTLQQDWKTVCIFLFLSGSIPSWTFVRLPSVRYNIVIKNNFKIMNDIALTPEQQADLNKRVEAFNGELIPLLGKYKLGLGASAGLTPDGRVFARPQLFDDSQKKEETPVGEKAPVPSPVQDAAPVPAIVEG